MATLRPRLEAIVRQLLTGFGREVPLDAIGEALGTEAASADEIDAMMAKLERAGRSVVGPQGQHGEAALRQVLPAARALAERLGRKPTLAELATEVRMTEEAVRHALALGSVIGR